MATLSDRELWRQVESLEDVLEELIDLDLQLAGIWDAARKGHLGAAMQKLGDHISGLKREYYLAIGEVSTCSS